jgi:hypothetical protein
MPKHEQWFGIMEGLEFLAVATTEQEDAIRSKLWRQHLSSPERGSGSPEEEMGGLREAFRKEIDCQEDVWIRRRIGTFFHATNLFAARSIWNRGFQQGEIIDLEDQPLLRRMSEVCRDWDGSCIGLPRMVKETGGEHRFWGSQDAWTITHYVSGPEWFRLFSGQNELRSGNREAGRQVVEGKVTAWGLEDCREEMLAFFDKYWTRFATREEGVGLVIFGVNPESLRLERYEAQSLPRMAEQRNQINHGARVSDIVWNRVFFISDELLETYEEWGRSLRRDR